MEAGGCGMVEWITTPGLTDYRQAEAWMEERAAGIAAGTAPEAIWLLEHPPLYTAGTSARIADLTDPDRFPVFPSKRGGQYTYHGPGQRVVYVMLDVGRRGHDVRRFVQQLEGWVIGTLARFGVEGHIREGRVGVWVERPDRPRGPTGALGEDKIAAIGIRLRKWISFHGISINLDPDLGHFSGIVPCGISAHGVTSLADLGLDLSMDDLDAALKDSFAETFGEAPRQSAES
jgi:lipoyl(octanoyl) transferase